MGSVEYNESTIVKHLDLKRTEYETWEYVAPRRNTRCEVFVVLTSPESVAMYADAGDNVATSPNGDAGVKIVAPEGATCHRLLTAAFSDFPPVPND